MRIGPTFGSSCTTTLLLLALAALAIGSSTATAHAQENRIRVGFGEALSDADILSIVRTYDLKPTALLAWTWGVSGTYRTSKPQTAQAMIAEARTHLCSVYARTYDSTRDMIRRWMERNSPDSLRSDELKQTTARSMLSMRDQYERAARDCKSNAPLIYGFEVGGAQPGAVQLKQDPRVAAVGDMSSAMSLRAVKPESYRAAYSNPNIEELTPSQIQSEMNRILQGR